MTWGPRGSASLRRQLGWTAVGLARHGSGHVRRTALAVERVVVLSTEVLSVLPAQLSLKRATHASVAPSQT